MPTHRLSYESPEPENWSPGSLLARLDRTARDDLLRRGGTRRYLPKEVLLSQGNGSTHVLVLINGYAKVTAVGDNGTITLLAIRRGGDLIGELAAIDRGRRVCTVVAVGEVTARVVSRPAFLEFMDQYPKAALVVSSCIAEKLRGATNRFVDFNGRDVRGRLARILVDLAVRFGQPTGDGIELGVPLTQLELAGLVSASEPSVQRALASLRRDRLVT
jgi:CRP-like cAMP-binding protein